MATRWTILRPSWPTRIVIQKHTYWRATKKSCSVQKWTFDIAEKRNHKVCIILLWGTSRLYSSFPNAHEFWNYYSRFQGRRCFYWINRSYEIDEETSILHFDIEWYTKKEDPSALEKLRLIKTATMALTNKTISFHEERHSRPHQKWGWKNSSHI